jgi:hypothetical protein
MEGMVQEFVLVLVRISACDGLVFQRLEMLDFVKMVEGVLVIKNVRVVMMLSTDVVSTRFARSNIY